MYNLIDAYSLEVYIAEVRSGKTLCMTAETYDDLIQNKLLGKIKIFSNYHLNSQFFGKVTFISKEDVIKYHENKEEFRNSIILLDELQTIIDNREFMKKGNKAISYFIGQGGKRGNVIRGTLHDYNMMDIRGRIYAQKLTYVFKGLINPITKKWEQLLNVNRKLSDEENSRLYIYKEVYIKKLVKGKWFMPEFSYIKLKLKNPFVQASKYFKMYKTEELI